MNTLSPRIGNDSKNVSSRHFHPGKSGEKKWKLDDAMLFIIAIPTSVSPLWG